MVKIQVFGQGLIPRGYGIAPRKTPFEADLSLIKTIMTTPGLKVHLINPANQKSVEVTHSNVERLYDIYSGNKPSVNEVIPEVKKEELVEVKKDVIPEVKDTPHRKEEKKDQNLKVVNQPNKNQ